MIVLSLCDKTTNMVKPWAAAGYECWCVDIAHDGDTRDGNIRRIGADLRWWYPPAVEYAACFAFPPCTHLAVSGARWFTAKGLPCLAEGIEIVERCRAICEATRAPWCLENPVSVLSSHMGKPQHTFDPCDYGDPYTKKTCLWTGGGFVMPPKHRVEPTQGSKMHLLPPSDDRADLRSATPMGFAQAVFESNAGIHLEARTQA